MSEIITNGFGIIGLCVAGVITYIFLTFAVYITVDTYYSIKERKK